jgi:hypothetical protein
MVDESTNVALTGVSYSRSPKTQVRQSYTSPLASAYSNRLQPVNSSKLDPVIVTTVFPFTEPSLGLTERGTALPKKKKKKKE